MQIRFRPWIRKGIAVTLVAALLINLTPDSRAASDVAAPSKIPTGESALVAVGRIVHAALFDGIPHTNPSLNLGGQDLHLRGVHDFLGVGAKTRTSLVPSLDPRVLAFLERARQAGGYPEDSSLAGGMNQRTDETAPSRNFVHEVERRIQILSQVSKSLKSFEVVDIRRMPIETLDDIARQIWEKHQFVQNGASKPATDATSLAGPPAIGLGSPSIATLHRNLLLPDGQHVESPPNRGPPALPASSHRPDSNPIWRAVTKAAHIAGSFFASLFPSPKYDTNRTINKAKFGLRLAGLNVGIAFGILALAGMMGWHEHGNYQISLPDNLPEAIGFLTAGVVMAPVMEELLFRVLGYGVVRDIIGRYIGKVNGILIAGVANMILFTIVHETADPVLIGIRMVGTALLLYAYQKAGATSSIVEHATFNFLLMFPSCFLVKGLGLSETLAGVLTVLIYASLFVAAWLHDLGTSISRKKEPPNGGSSSPENAPLAP